MNLRKRKLLIFILLSGILLAGLYFVPPVHERAARRLEELSLRIAYQLNPPAKAIFVPTQQQLAAPQVRRIQAGITDEPLQADIKLTTGPSQTPEPSLTPTPAATPLPERVELEGVIYEDQHGSRRNYCAPANLSMALSYWGWKGDKYLVGPVVKPDNEDKNVMPYELEDYVHNDTGLGAVLRVGGDLNVLRRFIAAGYPVLVENGVYFHDLTGVVSWMGHYRVVNGYDDAAGTFITQDSFIGADHPVPYNEMLSAWRAFNYTYLVTYPPEKEAEVMQLLGPDADETANQQNAALIASNEIYGLSGIEQYFAWFNRGSSLAALQDYGGAAAAFDESFKIYPTIPEAERPWRMLWYQTGPYFAYYGIERYYDLLYLADSTLAAMQGDKNLEESYYWRGMARVSLGETQAAIEDFQTSLKYHPGFEPALYQLELLGANN